jgi:hypothetical protein
MKSPRHTRLASDEAAAEEGRAKSAGKKGKKGREPPHNDHGAVAVPSWRDPDALAPGEPTGPLPPDEDDGTSKERRLTKVKRGLAKQGRKGKRGQSEAEAADALLQETADVELTGADRMPRPPPSASSVRPAWTKSLINYLLMAGFVVSVILVAIPIVERLLSLHEHQVMRIHWPPPPPPYENIFGDHTDPDWVKRIIAGTSPPSPPSAKLSRENCHAHMRDKSHLFRRMWSSSAWSSMAGEDPMCWEVKREVRL